eukprot:s3031_g7.t1
MAMRKKELSFEDFLRVIMTLRGSNAVTLKENHAAQSGFFLEGHHGSAPDVAQEPDRAPRRYRRDGGSPARGSCLPTDVTWRSSRSLRLTEFDEVNHTCFNKNCLTYAMQYVMGIVCS